VNAEGTSLPLTTLPPGLSGRAGQAASAFYGGLFLLSGSTMIYEIMLARLLSVVTWYYLALAAVGMAMSGMTAGALVVQLIPSFFEQALHERRIRQGAFAMALALPLGLVGMLAVPLALSRSIETIFSFSLFTGFAGLPFFFSGIVVCLALTRSPLPIGKLYLADLFGAAAGCVISVVLLEALGAPGAILACSAIGFLAAAAFAFRSPENQLTGRNLLCALVLGVASILNASSRYGIEPIWAKGKVESRYHLIAEDWNPISRVTAFGPYSSDSTYMFGPSPKMPATGAPFINLTIDSFADTPLYRRTQNGPSQFEFLNYDVTSFAYLLRGGGSAAIIGIGGGRDGLAAWLNGFTRIVGVEINGAIVDLDLRRLNWWSGLASVPGLVIYRDDGRSFLTRSREKFDVIQASMIDTQAGTAAGARSTTENSLFTVEAWRIFYHHLAPGGVLSFSRWAPADSPQIVETLRIFSLAWETLMSEGTAEPADHLALIRSDKIATLLVRNVPFGPEETARIRRLADQMQYQILYLPGQPPLLPDLNRVLAARSSADLAALRYRGFLNFAPVHDFSPFFYDFVRPSDLPRAIGASSGLAGSEAIAFLLLFTLASLAVLVAALVIPLIGIGQPGAQFDRTLVPAAVYFIAIGLGFMFAEAALMQQLTLLLGAPTHSLVVVLTGLIFFAGLGSLASDRLALTDRILSPAAAALILLLLSGVLLPIVHRVAGENLPSRVAIALLLLAFPGFAMGACFPIGLRWLRSTNRDAILPWMWALNGGASVVATFGALLVSMQLSIGASLAFAGICYLVAASVIALRQSPAPVSRPYFRSA
jgi:hypothetical protein